MLKGISESLHLADKIYGSWENSPGNWCDNHLSVELIWIPLRSFRTLINIIWLNKSIQKLTYQ